MRCKRNRRCGLSDGIPPSVTMSARFFIGIGMTDVIGSNACDIDGCQFLDEGEDGVELVLQMRHVASTILIRARCAMRRTVAESTDMNVPWFG